ncbi:hypothetical protein D3C81_874330 [compost metagenome]
MLEHRDFAGDIGIMRTAAQAGLDHSRRGGGKRSGAVDDHGDVGQGVVGGAAVLQVEHPALHAEQTAQRMHSGGIAPSEQRRQPLAASLFGDQVAGIAVGPVDHPAGFAHDCASIRLNG